MKRLATGIIYLYKTLVSPVLPPACRFHPTCSDYAREAIERHGPARGTFYAIKRLLRCHPYNPGGFDPVPARDAERGFFEEEPLR